MKFGESLQDGVLYFCNVIYNWVVKRVFRCVKRMYVTEGLDVDAVVGVVIFMSYACVFFVFAGRWCSPSHARPRGTTC